MQYISDFQPHGPSFPRPLCIDQCPSTGTVCGGLVAFWHLTAATKALGTPNQQDATVIPFAGCHPKYLRFEGGRRWLSSGARCLPPLRTLPLPTPALPHIRQSFLNTHTHTCETGRHMIMQSADFMLKLSHVQRRIEHQPHCTLLWPMHITQKSRASANSPMHSSRCPLVWPSSAATECAGGLQDKPLPSLASGRGRIPVYKLPRKWASTSPRRDTASAM